jgi:hypothetical protein
MSSASVCSRREPSKIAQGKRSAALGKRQTEGIRPGGADRTLAPRIAESNDGAGPSHRPSGAGIPWSTPSPGFHPGLFSSLPSGKNCAECLVIPPTYRSGTKRFHNQRAVILSSMTRGASYGEKMTPEFPLILLGLSFVSSGAKRSGVEGPAFVFSSRVSQSNRAGSIELLLNTLPYCRNHVDGIRFLGKVYRRLLSCAFLLRCLLSFLLWPP